MKLDPLNCYKTYLALKSHFTKDTYDYHKYNGKVRANLNSFYKRKDRFWFEKLSRNKDDQQIVEFFVSNFSSCDDPQSLWIGEIIKNGEDTYKKWKKKTESLSYIFKQEVSSLFTSENFDEMFKISDNKHPKILKEFLQKNISIETLIILNKILNYKEQFDKRLNDPVWKFISMKIEKYSPFVYIDFIKYKQLLRECVL